MTQATGNNQEPEKKPAPWEQQWALKPQQAITDAIDTVKKTVEGIKMPWERDWTEKPRTPLPKQEKTPTEPSKAPAGDFSKESNLKALATLSPKEQERSDRFERSDANLRQLDTELARPGLSPEAKKALTEERARLIKIRGGN